MYNFLFVPKASYAVPSKEFQANCALATPINDVCDAIQILINKPHVKGVLDIGSGNPIRIRNLAPNAPIRLNTPNERTFTCANMQKMKSLGFKPKYNIENYLTNADKGIILNITNGEPA